MSAPIGPYQVVRELGRGGMGVVLEVRHPAFGRPLALKLLGAEADQPSPDEEARFAREMQLLAELGHPGVVRVHDAGRDERGRPYMVAELVPGEDLSRLTRTGPLEPRRAAEIARALADTLAHVHGKGIVHRDLKPGNVILTPEGRPVLLDFGLARAAHKERLTRTGAVMGTPAYMAPEQVEGVDVGPPADVYGLGGVLFFLLAGRPPFRGAGMAVLKQVLCDEPEWPSRERPDLPRDLEAICRQAMAKDPAARYPSAAALRDDLDRFLRGEPVAAVPPALPRRLGRMGLVLGSLVVLCGAASLVLWTQRSGLLRGEAAGVTSRRERLAPPTLDDKLDQLLHPAEGEVPISWLQDWIKEHAAAPSAARARRALREEGARRPLAELRHRPGPSPGPEETDAWWKRQVKGLFLDERTVLTLAEGSLQLWSIVDDVGRVTSRTQAWLPLGEQAQAAVLLSPEALLVSVAWIGHDHSDHGRVELRDARTLERRAVLHEQDYVPTCLALVNRGSGRARLAVGGKRGQRDGELTLLEQKGEAWVVRAQASYAEARVQALLFSPDGQLFVSVGNTADKRAGGERVDFSPNALERWDWSGEAAPQDPAVRVGERFTAALVLAYTPGEGLFTGDYLNAIYRFSEDFEHRGSLGQPDEKAVILAHGGSVRALHLFPRDRPRWLVSSSGDLGPDRGPRSNQLRWWALRGLEEPPQELTEWQRLKLVEPPMQVDVSPAGRWYVVGLPDRVELYAVPPLSGE